MVRDTSPTTWEAMAAEARHIKAMVIPKPTIQRLSRLAAEVVGFEKA
jgi:hypothetical protein